MSIDLTQATLKEAGTAEGTSYHHLKNARKKRNISVADIANTLNLTVTLIEKIEVNDFSDIAPIFAKGYVRSYANIVKLPEEQLVEVMSFIKDNTEAQNNIKMPNARRYVKDKKRWPGVLFCILVFIAVVVSISYLQSSHRSSSSEASSQENISAATSMANTSTGNNNIEGSLS